MSTHKKLLLFTAALFILLQAKSQGVGVGVETPNPNAVLELVSPGNNQGLLVPKLTTAERTASSFTNNLTASENGLLVYDTDENAFYFWINSQWVSMQTAVNVTAGEGIQIVDGEIANTGDLDAANEIQDISLSGTQLSITDGSTIDLSTIDTDTQLSESEVDAFVSNNGFINAESDPSVPANLKDGVDWNELASIPADLVDGDDDTQLTEAEVDAFVSNNGYLTTEMDGSVSNEIQDLELDGNVLRITNNTSATDIDLSPFSGTNTDEQDLSFDGSNINITGGNGIDVSTWDTDASDDFSGNYSDLSGIPTNLDTDASDDFDGEFSSLNNVPADLADGDDINDADADPANEIQDLELDGNTLRITNNVSATDIDLAPFMGTNTDEQDLGFDGANITITSGSGIDVSAWDLDNSDDFSGDFGDLANIPTGLSDGDDDTQLDETTVDAFVANNGYLVAADIAGYDSDASDDFSGDFGDLGNIPLGLADGDDDTQLDETTVDAFVANNGYLVAADLTGYDSDASDDFSGDFGDLGNIPAGLADGDLPYSESLVEDSEITFLKSIRS